MKITKEEIKKVNKKLADGFVMEPLTEFKEPMDEVSHEMAFGLAQMYAINGCRFFIINEINRAIKASVMNSDTVSSMMFYKCRALAFQELLLTGKRMYNNMERLRKNAERETPNTA